jgi:hypothetical protein
MAKAHRKPGHSPEEGLVQELGKGTRSEFEAMDLQVLKLSVMLGNRLKDWGTTSSFGFMKHISGEVKLLETQLKICESFIRNDAAATKAFKHFSSNVPGATTSQTVPSGPIATGGPNQALSARNAPDWEQEWMMWNNGSPRRLLKWEEPCSDREGTQSHGWLSMHRLREDTCTLWMHTHLWDWRPKICTRPPSW